MAFFQSKHLWVQQLAEHVAVLVLDREQSNVNHLDPAMLEEFEQALDAVIAANAFRLLAIRSGKSGNFCHGPSPALLASWRPDDFRAWCERGQAVCNKLADAPIPSICIIAGTCFDAGLELALACDHRVVVNCAATSLGFPELEWGAIPCWGGTQRLPRLIGLDQSIHLLLTAQRLDATEAFHSGLADDLSQEVGDSPPVFLADPVKRDWSTFPWRTWRQRWLESNRLGRWFLFRGAERIVRTRIPEDMPAPGLMLAALREAYGQPDVQGGLPFERQAIALIAEHPAMRNVLRLMLHREQLRLPSIGSHERTRIRQIGIVGGGTTALALYLQCAAHGYDVVLRSASREALAMGMLQVSQLLEGEVRRGGLTQKQLARILGNFRGTYTWTHFDRLHLILDASDGALADKQAFYQEMEEHISSGATVAPVSSPHRVEELQQGMRHPERLVGLGLIEPWNRGSLAEIVAGPAVAQPHMQRLRDWLMALGKCCLQVPDRSGGLAMRIWLPALNEAGLLVKEGIRIDRIDQAMRRFGMSYGPLEWMDRLGIDAVASLIKAMQPVFAGRIAFESGFTLMVEKGWTGSMNELGFYQPGSRKPTPHRAAAQLWQASQGERAHPTPTLSEADLHGWIQKRLVTLTVLEAIRCLEEGLVKDPDDLDCTLCLTGWATHRGGPIGYARRLGIEALTARCDSLASEYGPRFAPSTSLGEFLAR